MLCIVLNPLNAQNTNLSSAKSDTGIRRSLMTSHHQTKIKVLYI